MYINTQIEVTVIEREQTTTPPRSDTPPMAAEQLLALVLQSLDDDKAGDVHTIPLAGKSPMADYLVVASGTSRRHVATLADHVQQKLKRRGGNLPRIEGRQQCDWVLVDAGDIVIHLFRPEAREYYNLEKLWDGETLEQRPPSAQPLDVGSPEPAA